MKRYFWLIALCLWTVVSFAQTFKGKVTGENGTPIPYAALYLKELKWGFTTDDNGCFQTTLKEGNYTCEVSSLGYMGQTLLIKVPAKGLEKNVVLVERIYSLDEVNVKKGAEDPAYAVMRKAIANAPYYRKQVQGFEANTYLKGSGKMTSIPAVLKLSKEVRTESKKYMGKLFLLEEERDVTFRAPDTWEGHVKAYNNTFPEEISVQIGLTTINLYEPTIFGKVSPLSAGAFTYYRFQLEGCYAEGGYLVNKIKVIPRNDNPRLVAGDLYIIEDLWCVSAADLYIRMSGLKATVKIICKEVQPSAFLITSTSMETAINMMGFKAEASYLASIHYTHVNIAKQIVGQEKEEDVPLPTIAVQSKKQQKIQQQIDLLSSKKDITIREAYKLSKLIEKASELADTLRPVHKYERASEVGNRTLTTDSLADKKDSLYWAAIRSVPLKPEELQSYLNKEKIVASRDSLRHDSIREQSIGGKIFQAIFVGDTYRTKNKKIWLSLDGLPSYIPEYNFVDGFWLGIKLETGVKLSDATQLRITPSLYYTTARKSVVGQGIITLDYAPRHRGKLSFSGGVLSADYNGKSGEARLVNALATSLFGRNDMKLYDKRFLSVDHAIELANGLLFSASLTWQQRKMLDNHISKSWFKREAEPNIPPVSSFKPMPENELLKASFGLEYTPAHYYWMIQGQKIYETSKFPTFSVQYDRGFPVNDAKLSSIYNFAQFTVRQNIEFGMFNSLYWYVNTGMFWDKKNMQFPDFKHFATSSFPLTGRSFNTGFSLLGNYAYSTNTRWMQANVSWYTPYLLLKYLPFLKKKNFDEALHFRSLVVYEYRPYSELGYSIGFSDIARVGVFAGFDSFKFRSAGVSVSIPLSLFSGD